MKKIVFIFLLIFSIPAVAQFRDNGLDKPSVKSGIIDQSPGFSLGFLNSENFLMRHSFSLSYSTFGGQGYSLGTYTNSMIYKLMNNMNIQMDVSIMYSPYASFGENFRKNLNGVYISKAAFNYSPSKNMHISVQYRNLPYASYYNPYYGFYNGFYGDPFGFYNQGEESSETK